ncbi:MAG: hypothetical protein OFPII_43430 [Osedax symbiont Rs1]|nr:MAG: hypothetical protein OFPII_43430 [Osedax symbiont Rs1]
MFFFSKKFFSIFSISKKRTSPSFFRAFHPIANIYLHL